MLASWQCQFHLGYYWAIWRLLLVSLEANIGQLAWDYDWSVWEPGGLPIGHFGCLEGCHWSLWEPCNWPASLHVDQVAVGSVLPLGKDKNINLPPLSGQSSLKSVLGKRSWKNESGHCGIDNITHQCQLSIKKCVLAPYAQYIYGLESHLLLGGGGGREIERELNW